MDGCVLNLLRTSVHECVCAHVKGRATLITLMTSGRRVGGQVRGRVSPTSSLGMLIDVRTRPPLNETDQSLHALLMLLVCAGQSSITTLITFSRNVCVCAATAVHIRVCPTHVYAVCLQSCEY